MVHPPSMLHPPSSRGLDQVGRWPGDRFGALTAFLRFDAVVVFFKTSGESYGLKLQMIEWLSWSIPYFFETSDKARCIYNYKQLYNMGLKLQILNDTVIMVTQWSMDEKPKVGKMRRIMKQYLVGGLEHEFYLSIQLGMIIPIDFHILPRGRYTTNQIIIKHH